MRWTGKRAAWPTTGIDTTGWGVKTNSAVMGKASFFSETGSVPEGSAGCPRWDWGQAARLCLPDDEAAQLFPLLRVLPGAHRAEPQGPRLRVHPGAHRPRRAQDRPVRGDLARHAGAPARGRRRALHA